MLFPITLKTCANPKCGKSFAPFNTMQKVCSIRCAKSFAVGERKARAKVDRARKEALKRIPDLIAAAQKEFNAYIRERDKGKDCICCPGKPLGAGDVGGAYDCGHWRSVGSASHLRFDERNAHGQNKRCNRYGAGRAVDYRRGLIERIGLAEVVALEASNEVHRWTREELIAIRITYRDKCKELKKQRVELEA
jgi:hypothetical protein